MYERDQDFNDSDKLRELQESSDEGVFAGADTRALAEFMPDRAETHNPPAKTGSTGGALDARRLLEQVKEERALRKAVYDDLYFLDEED
jgi:hypothetical protein